jgi:heptaprenyl diphosphate synthase
MLSRLSIRRDLKIPGGFGELIGESFRYFALIMASKHRITRKNLMHDIDRLMMELSEDEATLPEPEHSQEFGRGLSSSTSTQGLIILCVLGILFWLPLFFLFIYR